MARKNNSIVSPKHEALATFGQWVSLRRHHLGLTQKALAGRAQCSVAWIKKIEQDRHPPGEELAAALAGALEIPRHIYAEVIRAARTGDVAGLPSPETLEALPAPAVPPPLPSQPTRFFGRTQELAEIARALADPGCRLLTLLGPGGIGKTRLSVHAAEQHRAAFDAVYFVSLREIESGDQIARAIADTLQLPRLAQADPILQVAAYLREVRPRTLLVLDNFEHVMDGADVVDALLEHAREAKMIVTSRERLRSLWEQTLEIPGLEYPAAGEADNLEAFTSVQLLIERARRVFPRFSWQTELPEIARLCRLVEGHPLALELAAAWVSDYACGEIADRIATNIEVLSKQRQDTADPHRSVEATFDYSYTLLAPPEQQGFSTLGIFEGSFEPEAAFTVAGTDRRMLANLVDRSLVQRHGRRLTLHELLRLYAGEKLKANAEQAQAVGARMSRYYLDYAREHRMDYAGLELEWGNFNAGLRLAYQQHEWQAVSDYITALQQPWEMRGRYSDARQAYRLASEAAQARGDEKGYADALREWGRACIEQGDYDEACEHLQQSLDLSKRIEYQAGIANAQFDLARIDLEQSDFAGARTRLEQSQQIRRELEDTLGIAATLHDLANVEYFCRNFDLAASYARDALTIEQASDAKRDMIKTLRLLAQSALQNKDSLQLAQEYGALAIKYCQELGDQGELAATLRSMAEISRRQHELDEAKKYADQSLSLLRLLGDRKSQARVLYTSSLISIDKYQAGGARSDWEAAQRAATASLNLCIELDDRLGMMYLLTQLGDIYKSSHDEIRAREFWSKANDIALSLNQQFEAEIRARLQPSPA